MKGIIFDIQKFALHDGPGIRTAVFLKGCPLRCVWCCNPESQKLRPEISYNMDKCNGCHQCVAVCPLASLRIAGNKISVDYAGCSACGDCVDLCPANALKIYGWSVSADDVILEVLKDKDYYVNSGGGMTLTGGEAMVQFDFALDLMKKAKENGIHTAIETSGYAAAEKFEKIFPFTDLFLFDYKLTGNELHEKYTGVDQVLILKNLEWLHAHGAKLIIRCPVIPGINDTEEHFDGIISISRKYPEILGIELLGYHNYGLSKYANLGMKAYQIQSAKTNREIVKECKEKLERMGCGKIMNYE